MMVVVFFGSTTYLEEDHWPPCGGERPTKTKGASKMTVLQDAILHALDTAGPEKDWLRHSDLFREALTARVSPVKVDDVEKELKWLFSRRRVA
jgi:hypothetical protein